MPEFVPREGQREMTRVLLKQIPQPDLIVGLFSNTAAEIAALGVDAGLTDLDRVADVQGAGVVNGEYQFTPSNWIVPGGNQTGDPATHPSIVFAAPVGGTTNVAGYYVRSSNGVLWIVGLHPDVAAGGALKAMVAGATYSVVPSLDTESASLPGYQDTIEIEDTSYSAVEGTGLLIRARRTTNHPSPGAASVNWNIAGLSEGAPTPSSGTFNWSAGESGLKTYVANIGLVTAQRVGSFAISSPVTASLGTRTSVSVTIADDTTSPAAVSLSASAVSSETIDLTFSGGADAGSGLIEYVIERSLDGSSGWVEVARPTAAGTYSDTGRSASTQYFYRIRAFDHAGNASAFATANATTHAGGGTAFVPDVVFTFEGTPGNAVGTYTANGDGLVQTSYAGGFGARYSNAYSRGGRATSAELSIAAGSDGDPADDGDGIPNNTQGLFGINFEFPSLIRCVAGDTLHTLVWLRMPASFNHRTNTGVLKFLRHYARSPVYGHLDTWIAMTGYVPAEGPDYNLAHGTQTGWARGNESDHNAEQYRSGYGMESGIVTNTPRLITRDQWVCVEVEQIFSTNLAGASHRIWVDGLFACEWVGTNMAWIDQTGVRQTLSGCHGASSLGAGIVLDAMRLFTYFNGYSPQNQLLHIDSVAFTKNRVHELPAVDAYGNRLMGVAAV